MNLLFSHLNQLKGLARAVFVSTTAFSTLLLIALIHLWFAVPHRFIFLFHARYAVSVAAGIFLEGLFFSVFMRFHANNA